MIGRRLYAILRSLAPPGPPAQIHTHEDVAVEASNGERFTESQARDKLLESTHTVNEVAQRVNGRLTSVIPTSGGG